MLMTEDQVYAQNLVKRLQEKATDLNEVEKSLGQNYLESQQRVVGAGQEADILEKQIRMGQERLAQLREIMSVEMGKGAGIIESLIALRPRPIAVEKGNGESKKVGPPERAEKPRKESRQ